MKKVIEVQWERRANGSFELWTTAGDWIASVSERRGGWWWETVRDTDGIGVGLATPDEAKAAAEASLGVQAVPQVSAVLLRWVEQDDGGAKLTLGDVSIAEVYTPIDDAEAVWYAESEHRIAPRNSDFPDRDAAMRAVEAAFGITAPLPVEVQP